MQSDRESLRVGRGMSIVHAIAAATIVVGILVSTPRTSAGFAVTARASVASHDSGGAANGDWIAYSTAPGDDQIHRPGYPGGSDAFLVRPGGTPRLVAGRGNGRIWNVCPAFSPNGRMLAYGRKAPAGQTIQVVTIAGSGAIVAPKKTLKALGVGRSAPCPKWSSDSSRLAYLDRRDRVVVRALDNSIRPRRDGDPSRNDFKRSGKVKLIAPSGDLVARQFFDGLGCELAVSRSDGSKRRVIDDSPCSYAIAEWSPDGRRLLVMKDMDGSHFAMIAVSVNPPFAVTPVVAGVPVNHARSWPTYGDVSWQPRPRR